MAYKYVNSKDNHEDLASGRVLYNVPGAPAFPVRLAVELFRRALERLATKTGGSMVSLYDPCCGSGYLLTVLGILHGEHLERLVGSDPDGKLLDVARKNLSLLGDAGLARRMAELGDLYRRFGKASHAGALESAQRIRERILRRGRDIPVHLFRADAAKARTPDEMFPAVDLVMADIPYGGDIVAGSGGRGGGPGGASAGASVAGAQAGFAGRGGRGQGNAHRTCRLSPRGAAESGEAAGVFP